jgi:hypothetical protein
MNEIFVARNAFGKRRVHVAQHLFGVLRRDADHQPVRPQRVADRVALAQELRVPRQLDLIPRRSQLGEPLG